ncbi:MAG TPA: hypothetical protein EYP19_16785 [Desulfobacterales bacterium]|nr:hypothetical protein [Desulfobacterales bacterium]
MDKTEDKGMKKCLSILLISAFMVFGAVGQAAAYYEFGSLVLSLYAEPNGDKTDNEVGLHLWGPGTVPTSPITTTTKVTLANEVDILNAFTTTSNWAEVNAGIWGANGQTGDKWVVTANNDFGAYDIGSATQIHQAAAQTGMVGYMSADAGDGSVDGMAVISSANSNSYDVMFNSNSATPGGYATFNAWPGTQVGEVTLGDLDIAGYVDLYLWYSATMVAGDTISGPIGIIRLGLDGNDCLYAELRPNMVPLPGALVLFGSGLLGLVGIRRRSLKA